MATKKSINFEQSLETLEGLIQKMESGELPLEESLNAFEEGVKLIRECQASLSAAEQRVKILMEENGQAKLADFKVEDE